MFYNTRVNFSILVRVKKKKRTTLRLTALRLEIGSCIEIKSSTERKKKKSLLKNIMLVNSKGNCQ